MKNSILAVFVIGVAAIVLPACSIPIDGGGKLSNLKVGNTYEVRPAISNSSTFEPNGNRSMYFVYRPEEPPAIASAKSSSGSALSVRTTAYTHSESDHVTYGRKTAIGSILKFGVVRSAAADWSRFPLGTKFRIKGQPNVLYEVDDYGSALVGTNTIDLYCPTKGMMANWGVRNVSIEVVKWGSFEQSVAWMRDRVQFPHVRRMLSDIQGRQLVSADHLPSRSAPMAPLSLIAPISSLRNPYLAMQ